MPLFAPVRVGNDASEISLRHRISPHLDRLHEQDLLLNVRGQVQQVHDLRHTRLRDLGEVSQLRLVRHNAVHDQLVESDGQSHELRDSGHPSRE
tara:strand:- start:54 stop:335 length:282 start_codon:yes stop_codon:yes gene_type:complete